MAGTKWHRGLTGLLLAVGLAVAAAEPASEEAAVEQDIQAEIAYLGELGVPVTEEEYLAVQPSSSLQECNEWTALYRCWTNALGEMPPEDSWRQYHWDGDLAGKWHAFRHRFDRALPLLNQYLVPEQAKIHWNRNAPASTVMPYLPRSRATARLLDGCFRGAAADGNAEEAMALWRLARKNERQLAPAPFVLPCLVKMSLVAIRTGALQLVAAHGALTVFSEAQLRELMDEDGSAEWDGCQLNFLGGELDAFMMFCDWKSPESCYNYLAEEEAYSDAEPRAETERRFKSPAARRSVLAGLKVMARIATCFPEDWYRVKQFAPDPSQSINELLWAKYATDLWSVVNYVNGVRALNRVTRCGIALELYRRRFGEFPDRLEELVSAQLLDAVPVDPFDGSPLRYRRGELELEWLQPGDTVLRTRLTGARVWSVGRDEIDGGGVRNDHKTGDVIFMVADAVPDAGR